MEGSQVFGAWKGCLQFTKEIKVTGSAKGTPGNLWKAGILDTNSSSFHSYTHPSQALQFQDDGNAEREDESVAKVATGIVDPRCARDEVREAFRVLYFTRIRTIEKLSEKNLKEICKVTSSLQTSCTFARARVVCVLLGFVGKWKQLLFWKPQKPERTPDPHKDSFQWSPSKVLANYRIVIA